MVTVVLMILIECLSWLDLLVEILGSFVAIYVALVETRLYCRGRVLQRGYKLLSCLTPKAKTTCHT